VIFLHISDPGDGFSQTLLKNQLIQRYVTISF